MSMYQVENQVSNSLELAFCIFITRIQTLRDFRHEIAGRIPYLRVQLHRLFYSRACLFIPSNQALRLYYMVCHLDA